MARPLDPNYEGDTPNDGDPTSPQESDGVSTGGQATPAAATIPPTTGSVISLLVTGNNITISEDQIKAAGGPWANFSVKVTPLNDDGPGTSATAEYKTTEENMTLDGGTP